MELKVKLRRFFENRVFLNLILGDVVEFNFQFSNPLEGVIT